MTLRDEIRQALSEPFTADESRRATETSVNGVRADRILALLKAEPESRVQAEVEALRQELRQVKGNRLVSAIFAMPEGQPHPQVFALHRPGDGPVAFGVTFPAGDVVVRWHGGGDFEIRAITGAIEQMYGEDGTQVVWLSEELEPLAVQEQRAEAAEAKLEQAERYAKNARICAAILGLGIDPDGYYAGTPGEELRRLQSAREELAKLRDEKEYMVLMVQLCPLVAGEHHDPHSWGSAGAARWCVGSKPLAISYDEEPPF